MWFVSYTSDSDIQNSSESETEDHLEADPAYETGGEDEVSTLTQQQLPVQDSQIRSDTTSLQSIEDSILNSPVLSSNSILQSLRCIFLAKDKHKWSSLEPRSRNRTATRSIVLVRPGPIRRLYLCKVKDEPFIYPLFLIFGEFWILIFVYHIFFLWYLYM